MRDLRMKELAKNLIEYSTQLQPGKDPDRSHRQYRSPRFGVDRKGLRCWSDPFLHLENPCLEAALMKEAPDQHFTMRRQWEEARMARWTHMGIRCCENRIWQKMFPMIAKNKK